MRKMLGMIWIVFALWCAPAWAGPERFTDARVMFTGVKDTRSTESFFGGCEVEIKIMGRRVGEAYGILGVRVSYAVDDKGTILLDRKQQGSRGFFSRNHQQSSTMTHTIKLKNPARFAHDIQMIKGEVELFLPTEANGGRVPAGVFMNAAGRPIAQDRLAAQGVTLTYVTKELFEQKKKEEMERAKREAGKQMDQLGQQMGEAFMKMFEGLFGGMMVDDKNSLRFWVQDPRKKVVALEFLDARGQPLDSTSRTTLGELRVYGFKTLPPPDTQVVVYLAMEEAVLRVPFTLRDIPLP